MPASLNTLRPDQLKAGNPAIFSKFMLPLAEDAAACHLVAACQSMGNKWQMVSRDKFATVWESESPFHTEAAGDVLATLGKKNLITVTATTICLSDAFVDKYLTADPNRTEE